MNSVQPNSITRRELLRGAAVMSALTVSETLGVGHGLAADPQATGPNVIQQENAREGATDWQLTRTRVDKPDGYYGDPPSDLPGLEVVGQGTAFQGGVNPSPWTATIYPGPKGNYVFNAATIFWCQSLSMPPGHTLPWSHRSRPHGPDPRVQQITVNLLRRAGCLP